MKKTRYIILSIFLVFATSYYFFITEKAISENQQKLTQARSLLTQGIIDVTIFDSKKMSDETIFFHGLEDSIAYFIDKDQIVQTLITYGHINVMRPYRNGLVGIVNQKPIDISKGKDQISFENKKKLWMNTPGAFHHDILKTRRDTYFTLGRQFFYPKSNHWDRWRPELLKEMGSNMRITDLLSDDLIIEFNKQGEVIWTWSVNENLLGGKAKAIELSIYKENWVHTNSLDEFNNGDILLSARNLNEIVRVSYPEGEVVWRKGKNVLSLQHHVCILDDDSILVFDNGEKSKTSRMVHFAKNGNIIDRLDFPFYAYAYGSLHILQNGNILTVDGPKGIIYEFSRNPLKIVRTIRLLKKNFIPWMHRKNKTFNHIYRVYPINSDFHMISDN
jgi:hypothetical protein